MLNIQVVRGSDGAASVIRTRDLTLTKGALYRWSYGSNAIDAPDLHEIITPLQVRFWPDVRPSGPLQTMCQPRGALPQSFSSQRTMARVRRPNRAAVKTCPAARLPASPKVG